MPDALAPRSPALLDAAGAAALVGILCRRLQGRGLEGHRPHRCAHGPLHRSFAALPGRHRRCFRQAGRHAARRSAGLVQGAGRAHDRARRPAGQQPARYAEKPAGESRDRADLPDPRHHRDGARGGHGAAVGRSRAAGLDGGAGQGAQVRHRRSRCARPTCTAPRRCCAPSCGSPTTSSPGAPSPRSAAWSATRSGSAKRRRRQARRAPSAPTRTGYGRLYRNRPARPPDAGRAGGGAEAPLCPVRPARAGADGGASRAAGRRRLAGAGDQGHVVGGAGAAGAGPLRQLAVRRHARVGALRLVQDALDGGRARLLLRRGDPEQCRLLPALSHGASPLHAGSRARSRAGDLGHAQDVGPVPVPRELDPVPDAARCATSSCSRSAIAATSTTSIPRRGPRCGAGAAGCWRSMPR